MCLYTPLLCAKFQGNQIWRSCFIAVFVSVRKGEEKKTKKLNQFLKSHISGTLEGISLKFGMWSTEVGGRVHSKNCLVSSRQHKATEVWKLHFCSSCQYTHGCCVPASWAERHTIMCLDSLKGQKCGNCKFIEVVPIVNHGTRVLAEQATNCLL